jgi:hypothetical protein
MPIEVMWSILIAMGAITTAAVLKVVEYARKLHLSDKELSSSGEELNTLKQQYAGLIRRAGVTQGWGPQGWGHAGLGSGLSLSHP